MRLNILIPLVLVALFGLMGSIYVVAEGHTAIVLNLGRVARSDIGPGLHFKWPLIESALVFDRRLHVLDATPERYLTRSEEHTSELQSLMRISYAVFCLKKKTHSLLTDVYLTILHHTHITSTYQSSTTNI